MQEYAKTYDDVKKPRVQVHSTLGPYYESSHNLPVSTHCVNIDLNLALLPGI